MSSRNEETALGVARARFVEGLPRKAGEIRGAVALLVGSPDAERPREEMRRRLHALYASAQVFRIEPLAGALRTCISRLQAARDENRGLSDDDLDTLAGLAADLTSLATLPESSAGVSSIVAPRKASPSLLPPAARPSAAAAPPRPSTHPVRHPTIQDVRLPRPPGQVEAGVSDAGPAAPEPAAPSAERAQAGPGDASSSPRGRRVTARFASFEPIGTSDDDEVTAETPAPPPPRETAEEARPAPRSDPTEVTPPPTPRDEGPGAVPVVAASASSASWETPPADRPSGELPAAEPDPSSRRPSGSFTAGRHTGRFPVPEPDQHRPVGAAPEAVANVLVVDADAVRSALSALLPEDAYEIVGAADPEAALRLARAAAPDVVLVDRTTLLRPGVEFVERLRSDPLTDFVPVVALLPEGSSETPASVAADGLDGAIRKPLERLQVMDVLREVTHGLTSPGTVAAVGDATAGEIADRLSDEIRRGLVEALEAGGDTRVPLGDGTEILAAAWSAIARVREHIGRRSDGRVRFRDAPTRGGPALLALADPDAGDDVGIPALEDDVDLRGRKILVADDDPSVVWFFANLLEEAGAVVTRASDGRAALDAARRSRPDVLVSDILMPRLDGLGVCREVQRDPALADLPVILISWKEDFLQRMRELRAGARGYLRKEASGARILAKVRQVLRPRARLEAQLKAGSEVRGRIEGLGIVPLLRTVAGEWGDARVVVRDAFHLFEVDLRAGDLVDATRTAIDGAFARGPHVLPELLGSTAGRFTATRGHGAHRPTVSGSLDATLRRAVDQVAAVVDAVSGTALARAASVGFDDDVVRPLLQASPERTRRLVDWLSQGKGPRDLMMEGLVSPQALEADLVDLARRGAIAEVRGPLGEDRIAEASRAREDARDAASLPAPALAEEPDFPDASAPGDRAPAVDPPSAPFSAAPAEATPLPAPSAAPLFSTPARVPPPAGEAASSPPPASLAPDGGDAARLPVAGPGAVEPGTRDAGLPDAGMGHAVRPASPLPDPFPAGDDTEEMDLPEGGFAPPPGAVDPFATPAAPGDATPPRAAEDAFDHEEDDEEDEDEQTLVRDPFPAVAAAALDDDEPTRIRPSWPIGAEAGGPGSHTGEADDGEADDDPAAMASARADASGPVRTSDPGEADASGPRPPLAAASLADDDAGTGEPAAAWDQGPPEDPDAPTEETFPHAHEDTHPVPAARGGRLRFVVGLALMFLVGYGVMTFAYPYVEPYVRPYVEPVVEPLLERFRGQTEPARGPLEPLPEPSPSSAAPTDDAPVGAAAAPGEADTGAQAAALAFGERADGVAERYDGEVGPSEGLVVVRAPDEGTDGEPATLRIGERTYGPAPLRLALPEGRYELVFEKPSGEISYRFLMLRAGETRTLVAP